VNGFEIKSKENLPLKGFLRLEAVPLIGVRLFVKSPRLEVSGTAVEDPPVLVFRSSIMFFPAARRKFFKSVTAWQTLTNNRLKSRVVDSPQADTLRILENPSSSGLVLYQERCSVV
jgi:hypothetical protein